MLENEGERHMRWHWANCDCGRMAELWRTYYRSGNLTLIGSCSPKRCHAEVIRDFILDSQPKEEAPVGAAPKKPSPTLSSSVRRKMK